MKPKIAVITGAGAGVGRAVAGEFAHNGCDVALLSRDPERLEAAAEELRALGVRALPIPTDVADAAEVEAAAERVERELGPIDAWVNVAMATVFAPVRDMTAEEFARSTAVTYLGQVHGVMSALRRMAPRRSGVIVCVGSALAYRAIPLQSAYCGAKFAIRGFLNSLRTELIHDKLPIRLTEVDLPAINTPQFDWARNKTGREARPVAPIFQPEVAARAIWFAACHPRRQMWVGLPTLKAILGNRLAPGLVDHYLAKSGYEGQLGAPSDRASVPGNLFEPVRGTFAAHGRFDEQARTDGGGFVTDRERAAIKVAGVGLALFWVLARIFRRARPRDRGRPPHNG
jgi:NAD(P)-dependent dehydrogenase (short-subunit alcohol dehydrogenase family)